MACWVCMDVEETKESPFLRNSCECKAVVHVLCAIQALKFSENCGICQTPIKRNEERVYRGNADERIYFPWDDVYPVSGFPQHAVRKCAEGSLQAAICYLQIERLSELLKSASQQERELFYLENWYLLQCVALGSCGPYSNEENPAAFQKMCLLLVQHVTRNIKLRPEISRFAFL